MVKLDFAVNVPELTAVILFGARLLRSSLQNRRILQSLRTELEDHGQRLRDVERLVMNGGGKPHVRK